MKTIQNQNPSPMKQEGKGNRLKRGTISVIYTVVFLALIIALNLVISSVAGSINMNIDLSAEDFISIGEVSRNVLDELEDDGDLSVTIYMLADRDKYDSTSSSINGLNPLALIRDLCEEYAYEYQGINVVYKNLDLDPEWATEYNELTNTILSVNYIVVEGKYHARVLSLEAFFVTNSETSEYVGFNGELRLTTAILQSCISEPQAITFTVGHGESIDASFASILDSAGFELLTADLSTEEIDPRTKIVIISNPTNDFTESEVEKLMDYTDGYNSLITLVNDSTPELPNLQDYLIEEWGIGYQPYHQVSDLTHSLNNDALNISAQYNTDVEDEDSSIAYQIVKSLASNSIRTIMPNSVALYQAPDSTKTDYTVETVLSSSADSVTTCAKDNTTATGAVPLALVSAKAEYVDLDDENSTNQVLKYQYVMLLGSTQFAATGCIDSASYGNKTLMLSVVRAMGVERYSLDIDYKEFNDVALDIETGDASKLGVLICAVLPAIIMIFGVVIFFRRRHL